MSSRKRSISRAYRRGTWFNGYITKKNKNWQREKLVKDTIQQVAEDGNTDSDNKEGK